jgi:hypothetical protein
MARTLTVLVIEDNVGECMTYYIEPLNRYVTAKGIASAHVEVVLAGVPERRAEHLRKQVAPLERLNVVVRICGATLDKVMAAAKPQLPTVDLVLVDRTLGCIAKDVIFRQLCKLTKVPVIRVSKVARARPSEDDIYEIQRKGIRLVDLLAKTNNPEEFFARFAESLDARLPPRTSPAREKSAEKQRELQEYLERLEHGASEEMARRIRDLDGYATEALLAILHPTPDTSMPPTLLSVTGNATVRSADGEHTSVYIRSRGSVKVHKRALRRRVLLGLQKTWSALAPAARRNDYQTWLDVLACGCYDLAPELKAIAALGDTLIRSGLARPKIEPVRDLKGKLCWIIRLDEIGAHFSRFPDGQAVSKAYLEPDDVHDADLGCLKDHNGRVRVVHGRLFFEGYGKRGAQIDYKYRLNWRDLGRLPETPADWEAFGTKTPPPSLVPVRENYSQAMYSLAAQIGLTTDEFFNLHRSTRKKDLEWWSTVEGRVSYLMRERDFNAAGEAARRLSLVTPGWEKTIDHSVRLAGDAVVTRP